MFYRHYVCSEAAGPYVVGIDAGATRTRAAIVTLDGITAGYGLGPSANPNSGGGTPDEITDALTTALTEAVKGLDPRLIVGGVFGIAGAGAANRHRAVVAAQAVWRAVGIDGEPEVVTDIPVAYASGSFEPIGLVVFAGTGAGAAVIDDDEIERRADANGYLIGDEGSAVWIGREAVRAVMRAYDGRGRATVLAETVPRALLGEAAGPLLATLDPDLLAASGKPTADRTWSGPDLPQAIIRWVYAERPASLGKVAPHVGAAARTGDPVALEIVQEAARCLLEDVDAVRPALADLLAGRGTTDHGLVVAGSLLESGPVADAVRAGLRSRFAIEPSPAGDGALGAARLAIRRVAG
jgi:glucosamine kinase